VPTADQRALVAAAFGLTNAICRRNSISSNIIITSQEALAPNAPVVHH
jgi:hypothetical protein